MLLPLTVVLGDCDRVRTVTETFSVVFSAFGSLTATNCHTFCAKNQLGVKFLTNVLCCFQNMYSVDPFVAEHNPDEERLKQGQPVFV